MKPYYEEPDIKIYQGHILEVLKTLDDESVNTIITSPPYWGLRDYGEDTKTIWDGDPSCEHSWDTERTSRPNQGGGKGHLQDANKGSFAVDNKDRANYSKFCSKCGAWYGQLGLEPTLDLYISHLLQVTAELKRVLRKDGIMFWNQGDSYGSSPPGNSPENIKEWASKGDGLIGRKFKRYGDFQKPQGITPKCLCLQNFRLILRMVDEQGWILRNSIIWNKPNHMPSSVKDRFSNAYEPVFMLVKSKRYWFDLDAVRVTWTDERKSDIERAIGKHPGYSGKYGNGYNAGQRDLLPGQGIKGQPVGDPTKGKNPGDVWNIPLSQKYLEGTGHSNRQGLNRPLDIVTIKAYKEYQQPIAEFLKKHIKAKHKPLLNEEFGQHKWPHWLRTDFSGAALPGIEDWFKLKEILGFDDTFDNKIYEVQKLNIPVFQSGRNPSDVWRIPTQPFPEAHFATFPEDLVKPMILAGCPKSVCKKCGKARVRITKVKSFPREKGCHNPERESVIIGVGHKGRPSGPQLAQWRLDNPIDTIGWTDCGCNAGWTPGIVLDPFVGAGAVLRVAKNLGYAAIGIDIKKDYCDMSIKGIKNITPNLPFKD